MNLSECKETLTFEPDIKDEELNQNLMSLIDKKLEGLYDTVEIVIKPVTSNETETVLRGAISLETLEKCVVHQDRRIRLNALKFVVVSRKSTLEFLQEELNFIISFLSINLKEHIEHIPLMKKALKRVKDSLAIMSRKFAQEERMRENYRKKNAGENAEQIIAESYKTSERIEEKMKMYESFYKAMHNICINGLHPGSVYNHRKSSLQLLCLLQVLLKSEFKKVQWTTADAQKLYKCLLLDTYENNKNVAFTLLKSLDVRLLQLDDKNVVNQMIRIAIHLAKSIRPIDSITAAYMLKMSILSPIIVDVLASMYQINIATKHEKEAEILNLLHVLVFKSEQSVDLAEKNIVRAITQDSLYGYIYCMRSLLEDYDLSNPGKDVTLCYWNDIILRIISVCFNLSNAVSVIVNNSSPEGHLPMDLESMNSAGNFELDDTEVTPQMVLLCSWRTVKEVSLLFGELATKVLDDNTSNIRFVHADNIAAMGEHLVTLLSETKHRGAFEQAHVGFSMLCKKLWRTKDECLSILPITWLHQIFSEVTGFTQGNMKLCATRRSAGVPFMVQALLSTEPRPQKKMGSTTFHTVMKILLDLTKIEEQPFLHSKMKKIMYTDSLFSKWGNVKKRERSNDTVDVPTIKTHVMNILRAIFRHSELGELVNMYVADGLIAAFKSYNEKTWAERNAATLLFSALIIRIFGVQRTKDHMNLEKDNKMTGRMFFERYPKLLNFILSELKAFAATGEYDSKDIQPILLLLSRLHIGNDCDEANNCWMVDDIITSVSACAKSAVYETRELAARTLVPFLSSKKAEVILKQLIQILQNPRLRHLNLRHGYALQILAIIKHQKVADLTVLNALLPTIECTLKSLERNDKRPACFPLATVYISVLYELFKQHKNIDINFDSVFHTILQHIVEYNLLKFGAGREIYKETVIKVMLSVANRPDTTELCDKLDLPDRLYLHMLNVSEPEVKCLALATFSSCIHDKQINRERKYMKHYCLDWIKNSINDLCHYSPQLQDDIFDFLYNTITLTPELSCAICKLVLDKLRIQENRNYDERDSYIRLLGKAFTRSTTKDLTDECIEDVYRSVCDNLWIGSLNTDFRRSVLNILYEIHERTVPGHIYTHVQWWTTILQLLVDDNYEVRDDTAKLVHLLNDSKNKKHVPTALDVFFDLFHRTVVLENPALGCVALFSWGVSLLDDNDYEMDSSDVFNKCRNYDFFEPVEISRTSAIYLSLIKERYSFDAILPVEAINWISELLRIKFPKMTSFRQLVRIYGDSISKLSGNLNDILDSAYKEKLVENVSCDNYSFIHT